MQGGVGGGGGGGGGGGTGGPTAMNQLWGGPACKRLRTPDLEHHQMRQSSMNHVIDVYWCA